MEAQWGDWLQVTDFDIRTALLRNVRDVSLRTSPEDVRGNLTNDLCAGLAYLYLDSLPKFSQESVGYSEFSPYTKDNWDGFREFLMAVPRGMEMFVELCRFRSLLIFEREDPVLSTARNQWNALFLDLLMHFPKSREVRICYLLGKSMLSSFFRVKQDTPMAELYYLTVRKSEMDSYEKPSSFGFGNFISEM